jgi:hypothetical protein
MAKVIEGSRSQLSGKADGQVYVRLNGEVYTRKLPKWTKNSYSKGMLQNQKRFKLVNEFCSVFKDSLIPQIWKGVSPRMSGYALFLKSNMPAFGPDGTLEDPKRVILSTGSLSFPPGFAAKRMNVDENRMEVSWPKQMHVGGVHLKDELMVIFYFEGEYSDMINTGIVRNDLSGTFALPLFSLPQAPRPMHVYLFFVSKDRRDYSPSVCFEI